MGTRLLQHIERVLSERGERLLLVETSSLPGYAASRPFYQQRGFMQEACNRDFYLALLLITLQLKPSSYCALPFLVDCDTAFDEVELRVYFHRVNEADRDGGGGGCRRCGWRGERRDH